MSSGRYECGEREERGTHPARQLIAPEQRLVLHLCGKQYSHRMTKAVLWLYHGCTLAVLWLYTVAILTSAHTRSMSVDSTESACAGSCTTPSRRHSGGATCMGWQSGAHRAAGWLRRVAAQIT